MHNGAMERAETGTDAAASRTRVIVAVVGFGLLGLGVLLGWVIYLRGHDPFAFDAWWNVLLAEWAVPGLDGFSRVMNWLGGGWFGVYAVPILGAIALLAVRRPWSAGFFIAAELVSVGIVQLLKSLFDRVRPEDIDVLTDAGSFPSGHVANAATIAAVAVVLLPRVWVVVAGSVWVVLMAFSRTYLHAHWASDTLGGAIIGVGAALVVAAAFWPVIRRESADAPARGVVPGDPSPG